MKHSILATALAVALGGTVMAADGSSADIGAFAGAWQSSPNGMRVAMGPTSAARLPGGPVNQSGGTAPNCSSDSCAVSGKNAKNRHKPSAPN